MFLSLFVFLYYSNIPPNSILFYSILFSLFSDFMLGDRPISDLQQGCKLQTLHLAGTPHQRVNVRVAEPAGERVAEHRGT